MFDGCVRLDTQVRMHTATVTFSVTHNIGFSHLFQVVTILLSLNRNGRLIHGLNSYTTTMKYNFAVARLGKIQC